MNAVESSLTVHMPGGKLDIQIGENYAITMSGPVTRVGVIDFDQAGEIVLKNNQLMLRNQEESVIFHHYEAGLQTYYLVGGIPASFNWLPKPR